ncbi:hypothetical protein EYC84_004190 [Monilinia fructicola]|uniref:Uncharacterized protein n=1 Tax=Monilinia fructicola TaxID=38448 RepID=A0A5M9K213_MONFR|nr:hypothetical protein EYC84_004190 [Monilinia fructicola]
MKFAMQCNYELIQDTRYLLSTTNPAEINKSKTPINPIFTYDLPTYLLIIILFETPTYIHFFNISPLILLCFHLPEHSWHLLHNRLQNFYLHSPSTKPSLSVSVDRPLARGAVDFLVVGLLN